MSALIPGLEGEALRRLWLVDQPQTVSEIHERSGVGSHNGVRKALMRLTEHGLVSGQRYGHTQVFFLNKRHLAYEALDAAFKQFDPYNDLRTRLADLVKVTWPEEVPEPSVSIFGSVAQRTATAESDLDLLLIVREEDRGKFYLNHLTDELHNQPEEWTGNVVHLYTVTRDELSQAHAKQDPIVGSWLGTADTVIGPSVSKLLREGAA